MMDNEHEWHYVRIHRSTTAEVTELSHKAQLHLLFPVYRGELTQRISQMERELYPPDTPANNAFEIRVYTWEALVPPLDYCIASVPWRDGPKVKEWIRSHNLRLADGTPLLLSRRGDPVEVVGNFRAENVPPQITIKASFPLESLRAYGLEPLHPNKGPTPTAFFISPK